MRETFIRGFRYFRLKNTEVWRDKNIWVTAVIMFLAMWEFAQPVRNIIVVTGEPAAPYFFPFFMTDYIISMGLLKVLVLFGYVYLNCCVQKVTDADRYLYFRTSKTGYILGRIFSVWFWAFLYDCFILALSVIVIIPGIEWTTAWGRLITQLAYKTGNLYFMDNSLIISPRVVEFYSPAAAMIHQFLLFLLACVFLGSIFLLCDFLFSKAQAGIALQVFIILLGPVLYSLENSTLIWFSPVSWMSLNNLYPAAQRINYHDRFPGLAYAYLMYLLLIDILTGIAIYRGIRSEWKAQVYHERR